jgi:hypothetical protein
MQLGGGSFRDFEKFKKYASEMPGLQTGGKEDLGSEGSTLRMGKDVHLFIPALL